MALEWLTTYKTSKNQKAPDQAPEVTLAGSQQRALDANNANAPLIEMLTSRTNKFNQQQKLDLLEMAIPGYSDWSKQMGKNASAYGEGKISDEQAGNLTRLAAERGIRTGARGQTNDYSLLRDFGVSEMQGQQASAGIMGQLAQMTYVNPMSPLSQMVTTQQSLGVDESNRSAKQAWMNAEAASKNIRDNAFWYGLAAGDATFQQASGMGGGGGGGGGMGGWGEMMKQGSKSGSGKGKGTGYGSDADREAAFNSGSNSSTNSMLDTSGFNSEGGSGMGGWDTGSMA